MHYHTLGHIPPKRHTQFRRPDGALYTEELFSTEGFSSAYSLLYHVHLPTEVRAVEEGPDVAPRVAQSRHLKHRAIQGFRTQAREDYLESRRPMMVNADVYLGVAAPQASMEYFFKNAMADELLFMHQGSGTLHTMFGRLPFGYGDYLFIPRGTIYRLEFEREDNRLLYLESFSPITTPRRYRNQYGQLLEHAPFCERDIRKPEALETYDERGDHLVLIKKQDQLFRYHLAHHPFDLIGWDGFVYPYAFSIHDFEPITGRIHQPPPVHQTFEAHNFVVCSFCPRLFDYHPRSIPAPYNHSNIDSDEVLYYVDGDFMSRKNVEKGMFTLHPAGIPHGPQPGMAEKSIGATQTHELAVMVDTFRPLQLTQEAIELELPDYHLSWLTETAAQ
jgi:homogentisate 1,2-dioxygenase